MTTLPIPLDPRVFLQDDKSAQDFAQPRAVPAAILAAVQAAPLNADLFAVDKRPIAFDGQILKVNTLTFQPGGRLLFRRGYEKPWLVVVAKTIRFAGPEEGGEIGAEVFQGAGGEIDHPVLSRAADGVVGGGADGRDGSNGQHGIDGLRGANAGPTGPSPELYIIAGRVLTQAGEAPPTAARLVVWNSGRFGDFGGRGQDGQSGGNGGPGKRSRANAVGGCSKQPGSGGNGGNAGGGGDGGRGGNGGTGGLVHFAGPTQALNVLAFSRVNNFGGQGGVTAGLAKNGVPGARGPRGARHTVCSGGSNGEPGKKSVRTPRIPDRAPDGVRGQMGTTVLNVNALF